MQGEKTKKANKKLISFKFALFDYSNNDFNCNMPSSSKKDDIFKFHKDFNWAKSDLYDVKTVIRRENGDAQITIGCRRCRNNIKFDQALIVRKGVVTSLETIVSLTRHICDETKTLKERRTLLAAVINGTEFRNIYFENKDATRQRLVDVLNEKIPNYRFSHSNVEDLIKRHIKTSSPSPPSSNGGMDNGGVVIESDHDESVDMGEEENTRGGEGNIHYYYFLEILMIM